jgi:Lon-like ATP-dependent protease
MLRCLLQLYVVKLNRKPLFPGIYTPVTITNNAGLIKEISDKKRSG